MADSESSATDLANMAKPLFMLLKQPHRVV
jgi:hypothetical protein